MSKHEPGPEILRTQGLPDELLLAEKHVWRGRYDVFRRLKMTYPASTANRRRELQSIRKKLMGESLASE